MKKTKQLLLLAFLATLSFAINAQTTISGNITDEEAGETLIGANILIDGTTQGTITDLDGNFELKSDQPLPWTIIVSYTGYADQRIEVNKATSDLNIQLKTDAIGLDQVIVSASRRAEKVTDAVASVSVLSEARIAAVPQNSDASELIRNVPGVNIVKSGTQYSNIELRGSATVNESNTLVMRDYAPLTDVANKRVNTAMASVNAIDLARVEVVRGPAGAIYGPNVTSGVVHFISKDPFKYPGTDIMVGFGEQSMFTTALRHAGNIDQKFGYKLLASYGSSQDFALDTADLTDNNGGNVVTPGVDFVTAGGTRTENVTNIDLDQFNWNVTAQLDYRFSDKVSATYVGALARQRENFRNQTNHQLVGRQIQQHQLRLNAGNFFASYMLRNIMGNADGDGTFRDGLDDYVYVLRYSQPANADGEIVAGPIGDAFIHDLSAQYNFDIGNQVEAVVGGDFKFAPEVINGVYGINNPLNGGTNSYGVYGGYVSAKYKATEKLNINAAARIDNYESYGATAFSPRIGAVYKIDNANTVRLNFSRSSQAESRLRTHLDFTVGLPAALPETHVVGVAGQVTFDNPVTQFAFGRVDGGDQFELANIITALATSAGVDVDVSGIDGTVTPTYTGAAFASPAIGRPAGMLSGLSSTGQGEATLRYVNQIEVGYKGLVNEKWALSADVYYNITQNLQPAGLIPLSPGAQLNTDEVGSAISGALAGTDQATLDTLLATLNTGASGNAPAGWGLVVSDRAQEVGYLFDAGFPTFGNEDVAYVGLDLGATYYINQDFSVWTNYSFVSKNVWTPAELGEENPNFEYFLNTPGNRANFGVSYLQTEGIYGRLAGNYASEYEGKQGDGRIFTGTNPARTIFDLSVGYRLKISKAKLDLGVNVNNLFDTKYKHFSHLPVVRRLALVSLKASF